MNRLRLLLYVVVPFLSFLQCSNISPVEYTFDGKLNLFIQELYLEVSPSRDFPTKHIRVLNVSRCMGKEGDWILSLGDDSGKEVASFHLKRGEYDEGNKIINLSESNNSGISGYAIVDWSVIDNRSENGKFTNSTLTESAYDLSKSPQIKSLVESTSVYVSSSDGDDASLGISSNKPLKTIAAAKTRRKDILLKCGDVFYESVYVRDVNISSYGEGAKPIVSGWKRLVGKDHKGVWQQGDWVNNSWVQKDGTNIWRLDLESSDFIGRTNLGVYGNNIGLIMDNGTKTIYGHKCQYVRKSGGVKPTNPQDGTCLMKNFDFCQTSKKGNEGIVGADFRYLYMYFDQDPGQLDLSFSTYPHGFSIINSSVSNVRVEGFGCHGFSCGSDVTIDHCEIEYIGGSQMMGSPLWIRLGNGVEFYISITKRNGLVSNNTISHVFDCATTIQGSDYKDAWAENIVFEKNRISECRQAFEHFLNNNDSKTGQYLDYVNCRFVGNICVNNGDNGFSSPEKRDACILSYENGIDKNLEISGNVFFGTDFYYGRYVGNKVFDNQIYLYEDQYEFNTKNTPSDNGNVLRKKRATLNEVTRMKRGSRQSQAILDGLKK